MNTLRNLSGAALSAAAASLVLAGCNTMGGSEGSSNMSASSEAKVHCFGVNSCKGQTACKTANNACKGMNACKGQGWVPMSASECSAQGGEIQG